MKKAIVTLSVILMTAMTVFAGGDKTSNRYLTAKFGQNWFIDAAGSINAWQGNGKIDHNRAGLFDFGSVYTKNAQDNLMFGGSLRVGKWVSPALGLRLAVDMNQATNKYVNDFVLEATHFDVMLNLCDWFGGYREDRIYSLIPYAGFGVAGNADKFFQLNGVNKEYCSVFGIMNNFRLGKYFGLHLDVQATAPKWMIESIQAPADPYLVSFNYSALLGLTWNIGGRHFDICEACPEVTCPENDCSKQESMIKDLQARIAELEAAGGNVQAPCDTVVKFIEGATAEYPFSIFFDRDSYQIRDGRDLINLGEIAKVAKDKGYKINLRGTCDSATATKEYNQKLAENRCKKVKDELVKLGMPEKDIIMNPVGGVKELNPTEYDRRVLVHFTKE